MYKFVESMSLDNKSFQKIKYDSDKKSSGTMSRTLSPIWNTEN